MLSNLKTRAFEIDPPEDPQTGFEILAGRRAKNPSYFAELLWSKWAMELVEHRSLLEELLTWCQLDAF
ncbi:Endoribonuclease Dcr-1 [Gossypium arboreum]|uniref:Endoribonuclease Dcr-1 n=1 Tax=Gossypium arboreum TaxID=29729 RepID=A0A0B0N0R9_GOSAR|nr:Endoribonuclease Dcr-1 [Gossypium arboreum]